MQGNSYSFLNGWIIPFLCESHVHLTLQHNALHKIPVSDTYYSNYYMWYIDASMFFYNHYVDLSMTEHQTSTLVLMSMNSFHNHQNLYWSQALQKMCLATFPVLIHLPQIGFAAADSLTVLKLTENGVPKDRLALLSIPLTPVQVFLPLYISRYTAGPKPLTPFIRTYPVR